MWWLGGITDSMDMNLGKLQEMVRDRKAWHAAVHGIVKRRMQLSDWTITTFSIIIIFTKKWKRRIILKVSNREFYNINYGASIWHNVVQLLNAHVLFEKGGKIIFTSWSLFVKPTVHVFLKRKLKVKSLSRVRLFWTPWTVARQAPPSMGFSRQEYWTGLPFPSPGDLPDPGIEPRSPCIAGRRFNLWATLEELIETV